MANIILPKKNDFAIRNIKNTDHSLPIHGIHLKEVIDALTDGTATNFKNLTIATDTINETTSANGVAVDGVTLKDGGITATADIAGTTGTFTGAVTGTKPTEVIDAVNVITAAETGKTFFLNAATGAAQTLPAPAAGLHYKFVVSTQPSSGNMTVVTTSGDNVIEGMADVNSTLVLASNEDTINFVASTCIIGDWVEVVSDGTSWFVTGQSGAAGGITFTAT